MSNDEEITEAHRRIEDALPEDEPDLVPDWVCRLLIYYGKTLNRSGDPVAWFKPPARFCVSIESSESMLDDGWMPLYLEA